MESICGDIESICGDVESICGDMESTYALCCMILKKKKEKKEEKNILCHLGLFFLTDQQTSSQVSQLVLFCSPPFSTMKLMFIEDVYNQQKMFHSFSTTRKKKLTIYISCI